MSYPDIIGTNTLLFGLSVFLRYFKVNTDVKASVNE